MIGLRSTLLIFIVFLGILTQVNSFLPNSEMDDGQTDCTTSGDGCKRIGDFVAEDGGLERQSDTCSSVSVPRDCKKDYKGICEEECSPKRIFTGLMCNNECKCCGCKIKNKCKNRHGFCITDRERCPGITKNKWCKGKKCRCCIPDCPKTERCTANDGRCSKFCASNEEPHPFVRCINDNSDDCRCCVKKCETNSACEAVRGRCDRVCSPTEVVSSTARCEGKGCQCCVRKTLVCENSEDCKSRGGKCRETCLSAFHEFPTGIPCKTDDCVCCLRLQTIAPATKTIAPATKFPIAL